MPKKETRVFSSSYSLDQESLDILEDTKTKKRLISYSETMRFIIKRYDELKSVQKARTAENVLKNRYYDQLLEHGIKPLQYSEEIQKEKQPEKVY